MPQCPLHKTYDFEQTFSTYDPTQTGTCRIRIFEPESPGRTKKLVIVASQMPASVASVSNFAERIAMVVIRSYRMAKSLPPSSIEMVWIEHYPRGTMLTPRQEHFMSVQFEQCARGVFTNPKWQNISRQHVERTILRCPLPD